MKPVKKSNAQMAADAVKFVNENSPEAVAVACVGRRVNKALSRIAVRFLIARGLQNNWSSDFIAAVIGKHTDESMVAFAQKQMHLSKVNGDMNHYAKWESFMRDIQPFLVNEK